MDNHYVARRIDRATRDLLSDGSLLIWQAGSIEPLVLDPEITYSLYLFTRLPRVAPLLRKADEKRQQVIIDLPQAIRQRTSLHQTLDRQ